jgi:hypothetical protein
MRLLYPLAPYGGAQLPINKIGDTKGVVVGALVVVVVAVVVGCVVVVTVVEMAVVVVGKVNLQ